MRSGARRARLHHRCLPSCLRCPVCCDLIATDQHTFHPPFCRRGRHRPRHALQTPAKPKLSETARSRFQKKGKKGGASQAATPAATPVATPAAAAAPAASAAPVAPAQEATAPQAAAAAVDLAADEPAAAEDTEPAAAPKARRRRKVELDTAFE